MENIKINFNDKVFSVPPGVTLLDALQDAGAKIPASCRSGVCQSCMMQAVGVAPPAPSQKELSPEKKKQGYFLACQCHPTEPMTVQLADEAIPRFEALVTETERLSTDILRIRFRRPAGFDFHAGQYVNFHHPSGVVRSYSLASLPGDKDFLDIHVRQIPGGKMTSWFFNDCHPGGRLLMTAARGDCCYFQDSEDVPLLMVGLGTGVAPLQAMAREAVRCGKTSPLYFYQGGLNPERLYYRNELKSLAQMAPHFVYQEVVLNGAGDDFRSGNITDVLMQDFEKIKHCKVYLCGDAALVTAIRKRLFIAGIAMNRIKADAFVSAPPPKARTAPEIQA